VIVAAAAFVLALWINHGNIASSFSNYLLLISYWVAAWGGVVVADWIHEPNLERSVSRLLDLSRLPLGINGLAAFLIGGAASIPFMDTTLYIGPASRDWLHYGDIGYFVGFVVALAAYLILAKVHSEGTASEELPDTPAEAPPA
jgi:NCS1 family nucleobase:cation symporter-1